MEKEEAFSLRDAMDEMDLRERPTTSPTEKMEDEEESRIYDAALNEAAELVWQHQNGVPPSRPEGPYRYRPHLRKNSYAHARTASVGQYGNEIVPSGLARDVASRSVSSSSTESDGASRRSRPSMDSRRTSGEQNRSKPKSYGSVGNRPAFHSDAGRRRSSMKRNISGEVERPFSGDQIWEEPEGLSASTTKTQSRDALPDALRTAHPANKVRFNANDEPMSSLKTKNRIEIHRNPPTRSRDAQYTTNATSEAPEQPTEGPKDEVREIRSEDIRAATSMKLKDRSPRLPEPTAVSDSPGRPIVSFDAKWQAPDESADVDPERRTASRDSRTNQAGYGEKARQAEQDSARRGQSVAIPSIVVAEGDSSGQRSRGSQAVPTICVGEPEAMPSGSIPVINVPSIAIDGAEESNTNSVPVIITPDDTKSAPSGGARPLPMPGTAARPQRAQRPRGHWSPSPDAARRVTALCHECGFPIEGRFVALAGCSERFHPQCLSCFCCGTRLEAMEISPEPEATRKARIDRIRRREAGELLPEDAGMTMAEDGDDRLRFYCHLDWHESFAPRCKHCKTPILGEHIVALGEHWHYGHFFCAECGDPFEHGMTHIEKDGYGWCINCQTKRTERRAPKCKKCRLAVIGEYIQALGGEWHDACFRCATCQGGFDDGQIFPKDVDGATVVLCTGCRAKELKL